MTTGVGYFENRTFHNITCYNCKGTIPAKSIHHCPKAKEELERQHVSDEAWELLLGSVKASKGRIAPRSHVEKVHRERGTVMLSVEELDRLRATPPSLPPENQSRICSLELEVGRLQEENERLKSGLKNYGNAYLLMPDCTPKWRK